MAVEGRPPLVEEDTPADVAGQALAQFAVALRLGEKRLDLLVR
jgi:hypothetical protein